MNYKIKYNKNGYVVIDDFLPIDIYNEIVDIFQEGELYPIVHEFWRFIKNI